MPCGDRDKMRLLIREKDHPRLLAADGKGNIYDVPGMLPAGMKAGHYFRLDPEDLVELHPDSELFLLPGTIPVGFDPLSGSFNLVSGDKVRQAGGDRFTVAAFVAPGYTATFSPAFVQGKDYGILPLFSYAAAVFYKGKFYAAALKVDREKRQELSGMDMELLRKNVKKIRSLFPSNRLVEHLETCALKYCCPAGRNFFLRRYEAPLPTSTSCNAFCRGCISFQPGTGIPVTQPRITFTPTPEEVAEVALFHIDGVRDPVVSFGQGCEGEPLMSGKVLVDAVRLIRSKTSKGMINLNTNASKPELVSELFGAGLDSMRVSVNSVREDFYRRYYRPRGYSFRDVVSSIRRAKKAGGFVSVNYLVMPGFTDSAPEVSAFRRFLSSSRVDMVQWRNLNYDPLAYFQQIGGRVPPGKMIGIKELINSVKKDFPELMHGYFNPSRARILRKRSV